MSQVRPLITGELHASDSLVVAGNTDLNGTLDVKGATGVDGNFDVAGTNFTVDASNGNTAIAATLEVTGTATGRFIRRP